MTKSKVFLAAVLAALLLLPFGCKKKETKPSLEGTKVAMIIAAKDFRDEELSKPKNPGSPEEGFVGPSSFKHGTFHHTSTLASPSPR